MNKNIKEGKTFTRINESGRKGVFRSQEADKQFMVDEIGIL